MKASVIIGKLRDVFLPPPTRKILFDHVPKCGGSSLKSYLRMQYPNKRVFSIDGLNPHASVEEFKALSQNARYTYDLIMGHGAHDLLDHVHPSCLKMTILRDPVERVVSNYFYVKRDPKHYLHTALMKTNMSLDEYVTSGLNTTLRNFYTTHFSGWTINDVHSHPEEAVSKALEVLLKRYDVVGLLNDYLSFVLEIHQRAHFRRAYAGARANVTPDRPPVSELESAAIHKITEMNRLDISLYDKIRASKGRQTL